TVVGDVLGAPPREQQRQLGARQTRPRAYPVGIDVHEGNGRGWIVTDAAALANERRIAQLPDRYVGEMHVSGLAENVAALARLPAHGLAQHVVGVTGAEGGDDMDRFRRPE